MVIGFSEVASTNRPRNVMARHQGGYERINLRISKFELDVGVGFGFD